MTSYSHLKESGVQTLSELRQDQAFVDGYHRLLLTSRK